MKAIIPVAGIGERLRPFTHTTPKPLLSLAGKPILAHIIDNLLPKGIDELVIVVGHLGEQIEQFVRSRYDIPIDIVWQDDLRGLGYAVSLALNKVADNEPVLLILGDTIVEADISQVLGLKEHTIGITRVGNPRRFGVVELSGKRIIGMEEKPDNPKSNYAIAGLYYFTGVSCLRKHLKKLVDNDVRTKGEIQLTDALKEMLAENEIFNSFKIEGWFDCGKTDALLETHRHLLENNSNIAEMAKNIVVPPVYVSPNALVENSILGPYVSIGENAMIKNAILSNTIVGDRAVLNHCILEDSILGNDSAFSGRAYRLNLGDSSKVELEWE